MAQIQKDEAKKTKPIDSGTSKGFRGEGEAESSVEGRDYDAKKGTKLNRDDDEALDDAGGASPKH